MSSYYTLQWQAWELLRSLQSFSPLPEWLLSRYSYMFWRSAPSTEPTLDDETTIILSERHAHSNLFRIYLLSFFALFSSKPYNIFSILLASMIAPQRPFERIRSLSILQVIEFSTSILSSEECTFSTAWETDTSLFTRNCTLLHVVQCVLKLLEYLLFASIVVVVRPQLHLFYF